MNKSVRSRTISDVSEEEWNLRCELAGLYRLLAHYRMTDLIYTHISARIPGPEHHFLINQYGTMFHEMRATDLVKIDFDGNIIDQNSQQTRRINAAGFTIHSAIHMARSDLICVIHTHTAAGIAVSAQKHGLLPISQHALKFYGHIAYHRYEGVALDLDERERLIADLGAHNAMILANHGLLVGGRTIAEAFNCIIALERACQVQIAALAGGTALIIPSEGLCRHAAAQMNPSSIPEHYDYAWTAALRQIENDKPDFRS